MTFGALVRLAVVCGWLALFTSHVLRHALPGLGLRERRDLGAILGANGNQEFTYRVRSGGAEGADGRPIGTCRLALGAEAEAFVLSSRLTIDDLTLLPGLAGLAGRLPQHGRRGALLEAREHFDQRLRLQSVDVDAAFGDLVFTASGVVDGRGLAGTWSFAHGTPTPFVFPALRGDENQGLGVVIALPPDLQPGERFTTHVLAADLSRLAPVVQSAVFTVHPSEPVATAGGTMTLLRVEMEQDARPAATLWCDRRGRIYRMRQAGDAVVLDLVAVRTLTSQQVIWPAEGALPAIAPAGPDEAGGLDGADGKVGP